MNPRKDIINSFKSFLESLTKLTESRQVSIECTNIFEDFLLTFIGIHIDACQAKFDIDENDSTRINFLYTDLSDEQAHRFAQYFQKAGDKDVTAIPVSPLNTEFTQAPTILRQVIKEERIPAHLFRVRADIIYNQVFPAFEEAFPKLQTWGYQLKSELFLERKKANMPRVTDEEEAQYSPSMRRP